MSPEFIQIAKDNFKQRVEKKFKKLFQKTNHF